MVATLAFGCSKQSVDEDNVQDTTVTTHSLKSTSMTYKDQSSFVSSLSSYGFLAPTQLNLNRDASSSGYTSVYGFNIPADNQVAGFKWNSGDESTEEWWPQGIAGFTWGGKKYLMVSWYSQGYKGVRVALANITDMGNITYRLILLVQSRTTQTSVEYTQLGTFRPVDVHAGGITYCAGKIFVASTSLGLRVFDLSKIVEVSATDADEQCGMDTDGTLKAFGYRYVLPQEGYYDIVGADPYSCVELGEGATSSDMRVWTGQYLTTGTPQVFGFSINSSGVISTSAQPTVITPIDNIDSSTPVYHVQGVYRKGTKTMLVSTGNSTYEGSTARFVRYNDGATLGVRYRWPHGSEDLYYDSSTGYLWCLTEYPTSSYGVDNRCVYAVRYSDYD